MIRQLRSTLFIAALGLAGLTAGCEDPRIRTQQYGYRGTAMADVRTAGSITADQARNVLPEAIDPVEPSGTPSSKSAAYQNVQVLGDVDENEFIRLMTAMTAWVSPEQGCAYCHNVENMADDSLYTKVVARKMLQMTRKINVDWKQHVGATGVTCYTCHRGQPVPAYIFYQDGTDLKSPSRLNGWHGTQVSALTVGGKASLPVNALIDYLDKADNIRVGGTTALPTGQGASMLATETTYSLMMHMSTSLGVNCTACHNSRAFGSWEQSTPQRVTAWYGIRMVRNINNAYIDTLQAAWPPKRLGPHGDGPKANCATCHQGVNKPLLGQSMLTDWPELAVNP